jgi:predicted secreted hydrolase
MLRRFALGAAAKALYMPDPLNARGGLKTGASPPPPLGGPAICMPADHYAHPGAPTEWWWNIGTLRAGERTFGFEINAASYAGQGGFAFTQIMLTDVSNKRHFQRTTSCLSGVFNCAHWAESDPTKDWFVALGCPSNRLSGIYVTNPGSGYTSAPTVKITGGGGQGASAAATLDASGGVASIGLWKAGEGYTSEPTVTLAGGGGSGAAAKAFHSYVKMNAAAGDPTQNMAVKARLVDEATQTVVVFDLTLSQQGPPFLVLGSGLIPVPLTCGSPLQTNNYYYSLTRLQASGTISINGETLQVTGVTWMDHEYGAFAAAGQPVRWILQDMQLDNGVCISNFSLNEPELGKETVSIATVQYPDSPSIWVLTTTKPGKPWKSPVTGQTYFMELQVKMQRGLVPWWPDASLTVTSLIEPQEFPLAAGPIYEGVALASGVFNGKKVSGTAWNEQTGR